MNPECGGVATDATRLASVLDKLFGQSPLPPLRDERPPPLKVIDCVLSLNRAYDLVTMATNLHSLMTASTSAELAEAVFRQKEQRRRSLAALPVEEKYRHFLQLQRMVAETLLAAGRPCPAVWLVSNAKSN